MRKRNFKSRVAVFLTVTLAVSNMFVGTYAYAEEKSISDFEIADDSIDEIMNSDSVNSKKSMIEASLVKSTFDDESHLEKDISVSGDGSVISSYDDDNKTLTIYSPSGNGVMEGSKEERERTGYYYYYYTYKWVSNIVPSGVDKSEIENVTFKNGISTNTLRNIFEDFTSLKSVDFGDLDTSEVTDIIKMFNGCKELKNVDLSGLNFENVIEADNIFFGCDCLEWIKTPSNIRNTIEISPNWSDNPEFYDEDENLYRIFPSEITKLYVPHISFENDEIEVEEGSKTTLQVSSNIPREKIRWSTDDSAYGEGSNKHIEVADDGTVEAKEYSGKTFKVYASFGNASDICRITIRQKKRIDISEKEHRSNVNRKFRLKYNCIPEDYIPDEIIWKSSNESVATVSDGIVSCVGEGIADIYVKGGDIESDHCMVEVDKDSPYSYKYKAEDVEKLIEYFRENGIYSKGKLCIFSTSQNSTSKTDILIRYSEYENNLEFIYLHDMGSTGTIKVSFDYDPLEIKNKTEITYYYTNFHKRYEYAKTVGFTSDIFTSAKDFQYNGSYNEDYRFIIDDTIDGFMSSVNSILKSRVDISLANIGFDSYTDIICEKEATPYKIDKASTYKNGTIYYRCERCGKEEETEIYGPSKIELEAAEYKYTGKKIVPEIKVIDSNGEEIDDSNYDVECSDNIEPGTAKIKVTFLGEKYEGDIETSFVILPKGGAEKKPEDNNSHDDNPTDTPSNNESDDSRKNVPTEDQDNKNAQTDVSVSRCFVPGASVNIRNYLNITSNRVKFRSSDKHIAKVNGRGKVTFKKASGKVKITAINKDTKTELGSITLNVEMPQIVSKQVGVMAVNSVSLNAAKYITCNSLKPTWISSKPSVVYVDAKTGDMKILGDKGSAQIYAVFNGTDLRDKCGSRKKYKFKVNIA